MKVLFVHDHLFKVNGSKYYSPGGLPASVWSRYLSVFDTLTVVGRDGGQLSTSEKSYTLSSADSVFFSLLPNISNFKSLIFGNKKTLIDCKRLVSEYDGVIARLPSQMGQLFIAEAIKQNKPYAVEVVGCAWEALWNHGTWKGKALAPFSYFKTKKTVASAPFSLYVTESFLQQRYPCKVGITTFCSNVEVAAVPEEILQQRKNKNGLRPEKTVFGLIGNYSSRYKGIDVAIRALAQADARIPDWELQVLGAGDSVAYSKLATDLGVSDKVKFVGSLPSGDPVYNWLDSLHVYLQPSLTEGLPRALVEAMSRGCPALGSKVGGIPELLQPEQMVEPGDYRSLADKIIKLVKDDAKAEELSFENFNRAKAYYKDVLEKRRKDFWLSFKQHILNQN